jgi:hypothetical protein
VSGSLVKCDNTAVTNGYVLLKNGNQTLISELKNGNYNFSTLTCSGSNNFTIEGFDFEDLQSTGKLNYLFEFPETHINTLKACNSIAEYVTFSINGQNTIVTDNIKSQVFLNISTYGNNNFANQMTIYVNYGDIPGGGGLQIPAVAIECGSSLPGNYSVDNSSVRINTGGSPDSYFFVHGLTGISSYNLSINKFGAVGDYIDVTFTGTRYILQVPYDIQCTAHVLRDH